MRTIVAKAPTRIDFAGGTTDIPPLNLFHHPAPVINAAVSIYAKVKIMPDSKFTIISRDQNVSASFKDQEAVNWKKYPKLELIARLTKLFPVKKNIRIEVESEAPTGSGLGASSSIAIAATAALARWVRKDISSEVLINCAKSVETQTIKVPTGYQDYWAAVYGGIRSYGMDLDGTLRNSSLKLRPAIRDALKKNLILVYTGKPHFSGINNWELFKKHIDGNKKITSFFEELKNNALVMKSAMQGKKFDAVLSALRKDWNTRRSMIRNMTTPAIDRLNSQVLSLGGALRVCGAGGGGCAMILVDPEFHEKIKNILHRDKMEILPISIVNRGVLVEES